MRNINRHYILANLGSIVTFFATSVGVPFERIIKATGLNSTALMDPNTRIPEKFILKVFQLLDKIPSKKNLSLELAQTVPFTFLGPPWRFISMSPDLRTMLTLMAQNHDMLAGQLEIELFNTNAEAILRMHHPFDELDGGMGGEVSIGISVRAIRECFSDEVITRVQFRHAARRPVSIYEDFFKVPVTFQTDFNAIVSHHKFLDQPNKKAGIETQESLEWRLDCLRQELGISNVDKLADIHKAIAYNAEQGDYSVFRLAQRMEMSIRRLQRHLNKLGTNAQTLLDKARYSNALKLLANERISIKEISSQLGFSSVTNFYKTFQRWSQKTPTQVRREMKSEEA